MKVKDIMTKDMVVAYPDTTISSLSNLMKNYDIGFLPVESEGDFVGVITDRDIVLRVLASEKRLEDPVELYMTNYTIRIPSSSTLEEALEVMGTEKVKRLLVEEDDEVIGIVSLSDILSHYHDEQALEYVIAIYSTDNPAFTNEIDIPQAKIDEFEL